MLHWIVKIPLTEFLCTYFLKSILIELSLLVRVHESVFCANQLGTSGTYSAAMEIVLVGKAPEAILLILPLQFMNLSLQIGDFLLSSAAATLRVLFILLPETVRIDLNIIP